MARGVRASRSPMNSEKRVTSGGHGAHLHKCPASPHGNYLPRLDPAHPPIEVKSFGEATQGLDSQHYQRDRQLVEERVTIGTGRPPRSSALFAVGSPHIPLFGGATSRATTCRVAPAP